MAETEVIKKILFEEPLKNVGVEGAQRKKDDQQPKIDPLLLAYMYIYEAVKIGHQSAAIQAKRIESNANAQEKMIQEESEFKFVTLRTDQIFKVEYDVLIEDMPSDWIMKKTPNGGNKVYEPKKIASKLMFGIQTKNQEISALRGMLENKLTVLRQSAQIGESEFNTVTNQIQQYFQEGGSLMDVLAKLTDQITKI